MFSTIFSAELFAILKAIDYIDNNVDSDSTTIIATDSLSSIQAIQSNKQSTNYLVNHIKYQIIQISFFNKYVKFMWIPGHSGIHGNELADTYAKESLIKNTIHEVPIPIDDIIVFCKKELHTVWQNEWIAVNNNKLREKKHSCHPWTDVEDLSRKNSTTLFRLRIGHTLLTHAYILNKEQAPICEICQITITVKHILLHCLKYKTIRNTLKMSTQLSIVLSNDRKEEAKLIEFLHTCDLLKEL